MIRLRWLVVMILCGLAWQARPVDACRYNVREVGFIDVGIDPYWLFVYAPEGASKEQVAGLKGRLDADLLETNIQCEVVPTGSDVNHPAMQLVRSHEIEDFPAAVLVSPDGQSRRLPLSKAAGLMTEAVASTVENTLHSPVSRQILENTASTYGVALLIEGPEAQQNAAAREVIEEAIGHVGEQLDFLPKPISRSPALVVLEQGSLTAEETLLWSLGLSPGDVNEPHAMVFYGRGRWIGPIFKGETLNARDLTEMMFVIGADCECGLDLRWLQGTMLPLRWDETLRQKVADDLGFDPENPMVKMEMVSIVRRGMGGFAYPGTSPFGYREIQVGGEAPEAAVELISEPNVTGVEPLEELAGVETQALPAAEPNIAPSEPHDEHGEIPNLEAHNPPREPDVQAEGRRIDVGVLVASLGGMALLVGVVSLTILLRAKKA